MYQKILVLKIQRFYRNDSGKYYYNIIRLNKSFFCIISRLFLGLRNIRW